MKDFPNNLDLQDSMHVLCQQKAFNTKFLRESSVGNVGLLKETCIGILINTLFLKK